MAKDYPITVSPAGVKTTAAGAIPAGVTVTVPTATAGAKTLVVKAASSSGSAIFTLTNTAPTASAKTASTNKNTQVAITLTGTDANNDALTFAVATQPAHGTASVSGATATYTPATGYQGADSFTYTATDDGSNTSTPATVSVTVNPATPLAAPTITVNGADIDNNAVAVDGMYTVLSQNGSVIATGFTPTTFDVNANQQYTVSVGDYGTNYFDHWHNAATGQDTTTRDIIVTSTTSDQLELTAVFRHTAAPGGSSVTVNAVDTDGAAVDGMFTTITATADNTQRTGFTTVNFPTTSGQEYTVAISDFGAYTFDHWQIGPNSDTNRFHSETAINGNTQMTAVFTQASTP